MIGIYLAIVVGAGLLTIFITQFADYDIKLPRFMRSKPKEEPTPDSERAKVVAVCRRCSNRKYDPTSGVVCGLTGKRGDFQNECEKFYLDDAYIVKKQVIEHVKEYEPECINPITKYTIKSALFHEGYTVKEETEAEGQYSVRFSVDGDTEFMLVFNGISLFINYDCVIKLDTKLGQAIAKYVMCNSIVVKIYIHEYPDDAEYIGVRFAMETLVHYAEEFRELFARYIKTLDEAVGLFVALLDEYNSEEHKRRRSIYNKEYYEFPYIVDAVTDGQCGEGVFTDEEALREYLRRGCDEAVVPLWDEFKILQANNYGNYKLIVYRFPEPKVMPEALYGAVLLDTTTHKADYYTLEYSANGKWALGSTSRGHHSNYGEVDTPDLEQFIAWIFNSDKQLCYYTDMKGHKTQKVN